MLQTVDDLTPDTLSEILRGNGVFDRGRVTEVQHRADMSGPFAGRSHDLFHLDIHYSDEAAGANPAGKLPDRLFLKFGNSSKECFFHNHIAPVMHTPALLRCFSAQYHPETRRTCLLLENLERSHTQPAWPLPPSLEQCRQTVVRLAQIHAEWWQHPRLEAEFRPAIPEGRSWRERIEQAREALPAFLEFLGDRIEAEVRSLYNRLLDLDPSRWQPSPGSPRQTLLHGDMHFWNVLYPRQPDREDLRIFDWNMWDIGRPTDDLAYLIALHWYPNRRGAYEKDLLSLYQRTLEANGVKNYPWEALWADYRFSALRTLWIPVWQWTHGIPPVIWWGHLQRGQMAFADLHGEAFLS